MASTLLGFVGTDENGLDGIEYAYDGVLRGRSGRVTLKPMSSAGRFRSATSA